MRNRLSVTVGLLLCVLSCLAYAARNDSAGIYSFDIPAQPLADALTELSNQAQVLVLFPYDLVENRESHPLRGRYTLEQALEVLLTGTDLASRLSPKGVFTVFSQKPGIGPDNTETGETAMQNKSVLAAVVGVLVGTSGAQATQAQESGQGGYIEQIVVTAQKREQNLQDVPLAVSAFSADMLESQQISDTNSLTQVSTSLSYQQGQNPNNTTFRIRGIGTSVFGQGTEASVSVVLDGVVAARGTQSFTDLADIERVEVLRGPQGTLFGKNATAGAINVVTARPSDEYEGKFSMTVAEDEEYRYSGTVSGPLGDNVRARLTAYRNDVGGFIENVNTGGDYGGSESWGVRGKLEWDVTDNLNLLFTADHNDQDADCCARLLLFASQPEMLVLHPEGASWDQDKISDNGATFSRSDQQTYSLEANWDLDRWTLTSITAYQNYDLSNNFEVDGIGFDVPVYTASPSAEFNDNGGDTNIEQVTQELRISSDDSERLSYVAGLFYSDLEIERPFSRRRARCASGVLGEPCANPTYQSAGAEFFLDNMHIALFGQAEYDLTERLTLIAGLRYQYEEMGVEGERFTRLVPGDSPFGPPAAVFPLVEVDDRNTSGKIGLQYALGNDAQTYATYSRGYKAQALGTEIGMSVTDRTAIDPEYVDAYEIGLKGITLDNQLSYAIAAFYSEYTDLQVQANRSDPVTGTISFEPTNAGKSETYGVEIEGTYQPTANFSLNGSITYTRATITAEGLNCPLGDQGTALVFGPGEAPSNTCYLLNGDSPVQDLDDADLPFAPEWRVSLTPRYEFSLSDGLDAFAQMSVNYWDEQTMSLEQDFRQDAYTIVDASVGLRAVDDRWGLTFFVKNLTDEMYYVQLANGTILNTPATAGDVFGQTVKNAYRYFGAKLDVRF